MSATITYKGSTLTTVDNATKTLKTAGKYMEGDVIITDVSTSQGVVVTEETDAGGGIIKHITAIEISGTKNITENGTYDVTSFANAYVNVSGSGSINNQNKTVTPTKSQQSITADSGYTGLGTVTVNAIPSQYITPTGTLSITSNGTKDVTSYASVNVNVPTGSTINNQDKTVSPTTSKQTVTADSGYTGLGTVTVNAMPTMTLPTSASSTSSGTSKATIGRSTSAQYINIPTGYNGTAAYYTISATPNGAVTAPASISGTSATVSTGTNTLTLTKTVSVTPNVTTAGYISSGTAGNSSVRLTASVTTKAAATITPTTTNQTIASGTYLTGTQTIAGDSNLVGSNILSGKSIFGVAGTVTFQTIHQGSSAPASSLGVNGDVYIQV